jgi:hypothetical protein
MISIWIKQKLARFLGCGLSNLAQPKTLSNTPNEGKTKMVNMRITEDARNQLGEKLFTDIYSVIIDNGLNIDPLANELGDEIDTFVELLLDCSEENEE